MMKHYQHRATIACVAFQAVAQTIAVPAELKVPDASRQTEAAEVQRTLFRENVAKPEPAEKEVLTDEEKKFVLDRARLEKTRFIAASNLRQIGLAMMEFDTHFGEFPNAGTAAMVKKSGKTKSEVKGTTANDCFYQLMAAGIVERNFFTFEEPAAELEAIPDKLEKCIYSYLSGMSSGGHPGRPLVVAPLVKGKTIFDPNVLGGKAVVLRVDCSVQTLPIEKDGRVLLDGKDLFDPAQPFWNGKVPPVKWPEN